MARIKEYLRAHQPATVLVGLILILTTIPAFDTFLVLGNTWQGILPTFTDELNFVRLHSIGDGHLTDGNGYYLEHSDGSPLVIFGGAWLNAIPLWMGFSFNTALLINFVIWSLLFAGALYWLFRELRAPPWIAVFGTILLYLQSYEHVWRPANLQPVFPFYFLFYLALARLIREQSRRNIFLLAGAIGATFYLFAFLWQIAVITMGLLFFYALTRKKWVLLKATTLSALIGGVIGVPIPLYTLWLSHSSVYFWESMSRLGLVHSHLLEAEVIYSGGWIGVVLALLAILFWRVPHLRRGGEFITLSTFVAVSGLGLWIMEGSNLITGILVETGEHVRELIFPWLIFSTIAIGVFLWKRRTTFSKGMRAFSVIVISVLSLLNVYYTYSHFYSFLDPWPNQQAWGIDQSYAKPLAWIDSQQKEPVVIWSDPHDYLSWVLPIYSRDFTLDSYYGMLELAPEGEIQERYLVSQYFNNPSLSNLKSDTEMGLYLGRADMFHQPETIDRGVKICRILFFWDKNKNCGTFTTPQQLLGDAFFTDLENKFRNDVQPNIKAYLNKYHVSYILKDTVLDPTYQPQTLGAKLVYSDDRYEIYRLP